MHVTDNRDPIGDTSAERMVEQRHVLVAGRVAQAAACPCVWGQLAGAFSLREYVVLIGHWGRFGDGAGHGFSHVHKRALLTPSSNIQQR